MKVIYAIINLVNGKMYVGSTSNLSRRKTRHLLRLNTHHSPSLQHSYNKHSKENFKFIVLESLEKDEDMYKKEQIWMDRYKTYDKRYGYNISTTAIAPSRNDLEKVYQYDFKYNLINIFDNCIQASESVNCCGSGISSCCRGKYRFYKGFVWFYEKDNNKENIKRRITLAVNPLIITQSKRDKIRNTLRNGKYNKKEIIQLDLDDNIIREWSCTKSASDELGFSNGYLCDFLKGRHKKAYGFKWKYKI